MSRLLAYAIVTALCLLLPSPVLVSAVAQETSSHSNLPVPRFATIGSTRVHMRQGPGRDHRILWVFEDQRGLPVEIIAETETWRQIRDPDGDEGWVHRSLLSRSRSVIVLGSRQTLRRSADPEAPAVAYLNPRVVARVSTCDPNWCEVTVGRYTGFLRHEGVWGVYPGEVIE